MDKFLKKHWLKIAGTIVGILGGYLYYHYVGCVSGTCPLTSNPYIMMIYGGLVGLFITGLFPVNRKSRDASGFPNNNAENDH